MLRLASLMRCAITRRRPMTLISSVPPVGRCAGRLCTAATDAPRGADRAAAAYASKSWRTMRPCGPDPATCLRSIPASFALRRIAGEVNTRPAAPPLAEANDPCRAAPLPISAIAPFPGDDCVRTPEPTLAPATRAGSETRAGAAPLAAAGARAVGSARPAGSERPAGSAAAVAPAAAAPDAVSSTTNSAPTATMSPGCPVVETILPVTGAGTSTAAFSVMTSQMTSSSATSSPGLTRQVTISASTVPSPRSGSLKTYRPTLFLLHHTREGCGDARGPREVFPLERMGVRSIPTRDASNRRLQMPEAFLLDGGRELRAEPAVAGRLVHDDAAAGFADRGAKRVGIERRQRPHVDDLRIDLCQPDGRLRNVHHRAIGQYGYILPRADDLRLREGNLVVAIGH